MSALERDVHGEGPARIVVEDERKLDLDGASGVVALGGDRFAVVQDDKGIYQVEGDEAERVLATKHHKELDDLEGICRDGAGALLVISERSREVLRIALSGSGDVDGDAEPESLGKLPKVGKGRNKGWEGLDLLPTPEQPRIVAVHEGFPRKLGIFRLPGLETDALLDLPDALDEDDALDLSDVAVEPEGRLFVLSDESATLVELELRTDPWQLVLVAVHRLELSRKEKAEALDFDPEDPSILWLGTDRKARLYRLRVER